MITGEKHVIKNKYLKYSENERVVKLFRKAFDEARKNKKEIKYSSFYQRNHMT